MSLEEKKKVISWLLMLIIPAIWEAEIRRITVQSQPRQIVLKTVS
jgi:hypothetical protein